MDRLVQLQLRKEAVKRPTCYLNLFVDFCFFNFRMHTNLQKENLTIKALGEIEVLEMNLREKNRTFSVLNLNDISRPWGF